MNPGFGGGGPEAPHRTVLEPVRTGWRTRREDKASRLDRVAKVARGRVLPTGEIVAALEALVAPGDRVALEGDNQKQADFLSRSLAAVNPEKVHDLHMLISSISRPDHLDLFERDIATLVDFSYAGPQSLRVAQLLADGKLRIGAIHTYLELYARFFVDLVPTVALVAAESADAVGNLYTGSNTEDTPTIVEATAFRDGIVVAQVNELVDELPRVDVPGSWVDFVVVADRPYQVEPLFTRDPRQISDVQVLMAMLAIRGVYERHGVTSLNHGIGFGTAAIELLLPTYAESLGLRGKICRNWVLNPHPTLIPAIESGWVETVTAFGGEVGMEDYVAARPDVFMTGHDGSARSNRMAAQTASLYGVDLFIGSTLQIDADANSSTVTQGRLAGFGGAPNLGSDARGVARGDLDGERAVVLAVEGLFQGGGIGEVSGAKIAGALELALRDAERGKPVRPVLLLETGGIRLQEANLGLLAVAEIHAAIVALRSRIPVVGVVAGTVGCFGGMAVAAGLCSYVIMTREGRLGLNGPQVIEQEAGVAELDSDDRRLVWETIGGEQCVATGVADALVEDDVAEIAGAVRAAFEVAPLAEHRSAQVGRYEARLAGIATSEPLDGPALRALWRDEGGRR